MQSAFSIVSPNPALMDASLTIILGPSQSASGQADAHLTPKTTTGEVEGGRFKASIVAKICLLSFAKCAPASPGAAGLHGKAFAVGAACVNLAHVEI
jgi:hypothetical protein